MTSSRHPSSTATARSFEWFYNAVALLTFLLIAGLIFASVTASGQEATPAAEPQPTAQQEPAAAEPAPAEPAPAEPAAAKPAPAEAAEDGQSDLDEAMVRRIDAETPKQLETVVTLLESAIAKGLSDESRTFANK